MKMGDIRLMHTSKMAIKVPVRDMVIHKYFNPIGTVGNDVALALLAFPVNFSSNIQTVCLPEKAFMVQAGTECWVTGWGKLGERGETVKQDGSKLGPGKGLPGALVLTYKLKGETGRQFSSKWVREEGGEDAGGSNLMVLQIFISMSGPGVLSDKQSGFSLGWI